MGERGRSDLCWAFWSADLTICLLSFVCSLFSPETAEGLCPSLFQMDGYKEACVSFPQKEITSILFHPEDDDLATTD